MRRPIRLNRWNEVFDELTQERNKTASKEGSRNPYKYVTVTNPHNYTLPAGCVLQLYRPIGAKLTPGRCKKIAYTAFRYGDPCYFTSWGDIGLPPFSFVGCPVQYIDGRVFYYSSFPDTPLRYYSTMARDGEGRQKFPLAITTEDIDPGDGGSAIISGDFIAWAWEYGGGNSLPFSGAYPYQYTGPDGEVNELNKVAGNAYCDPSWNYEHLVKTGLVDKVVGERPFQFPTNYYSAVPYNDVLLPLYGMNFSPGRTRSAPLFSLIQWLNVHITIRGDRVGLGLFTFTSNTRLTDLTV